MTVYNGTGGLWEATTRLAGQSALVYDICHTLLGPVGAVLAMLGVIVCPITSGDTAFRSARLTLADWFGVDQKPHTKRLMLSLPLLLCGGALSLINFQIIWRYFSWSNQTLAMITLWTAAAFLARVRHNFWPVAIPAVFMSAVCSTYILVAPEGFGPMISRAGRRFRPLRRAGGRSRGLRRIPARHSFRGGLFRALLAEVRKALSE